MCRYEINDYWPFLGFVPQNVAFDLFKSEELGMADTPIVELFCGFGNEYVSP